MSKKIKITGTGLTVVAVIVLTLSYVKANPKPYSVKFDSALPEYEEVSIPHVHNYKGSDYLPVMASAVIDVDGDGTPEIFLGGGFEQEDSFYKFKDGKFEKIEELTLKRSGEDSTYGASVIDLNKDGKNDLIINRESGSYIAMNSGSDFVQTKFETFVNEKSRVLDFGLGDINNDGHVDLYGAAYLTRSAMEGQNIFNKQGYGGTSVLLLNNGDNTFTNITETSGLSYTHNTFMGIFVDMDDDSDLDLVVAHDTGKVKIWKNDGDLKFSDSKNPFSDVLGYPMGIAVGDFNNSGLVDFYFSNVGPTPPAFLASGDITEDQTFFPKLPLFENQGGMNFIDSAAKTKLADYEFSWGTVFADLNLDGKQDIILAENYVDFPLHKFFKLPGRVLMQNKDGVFASVEKEPQTENRSYEITPLIADFNGDGQLDQIRVNLSGTSKAFMSKNRVNDFLRVKLPSVAETFGAKVSVHFNDGSVLTDWLVSGEGLCSDQEHTLSFGLGQEKSVNKVIVKLSNGVSKVFQGVKNNMLLNISVEELRPN